METATVIEQEQPTPVPTAVLAQAGGSSNHDVVGLWREAHPRAISGSADAGSDSHT
jgi:hypothetical protein